MEKYIEVTGVNIDDATEKALRQLGLDRDSVSLEVLEKGKKGFLGIGSVPAKVKVTYEVPDEPVQQSYKPIERETASFAKKEPENKEKVVKSNNFSQKEEPRAAAAPAAVRSAPSCEKSAKAIEFINGLLEKMNIDGKAYEMEGSGEENIFLDIRGANMGAVIGRRGDTLDAIQYLTSLCVNAGSDDHTRITIDTENYRSKRQESLERLARKMAGKVQKYRKNMTLEPMNPYERRIIHSALQNYSGITTFSTGNEPNRRVVIALAGRRPHRSGKQQDQ
jgi:spoIIIJ-associated protein